MSYYVISREDYLMHHGIKGQKWGIRRYQNEDGSLTPEGRERYGVSNAKDIYDSKDVRLFYKDSYEMLAKDYDKQHPNENKYSKEYLKAKGEYIKDNYEKSGRNYEEDRKAYNTHKAVTIAVGATAATAATIALAPKINKTVQSFRGLGASFKREEEAYGVDNFMDYYKLALEEQTSGKEYENIDRRFQAMGEDKIYPAGHNFKRLTPNPEESGKGFTGVYVNANEKDAKLYKSVMGAGISEAKKQAIAEGKNPRDVKKYERDMTANTSIKVAGEKTMFNLMKEIVGDGYSDREVANKMFKANQAIPFRGKSSWEMPNGVTEEDAKLAEKLIKKAEEKGYHALTDMNDNRTLGKAPAILINPDRDTTETKIHKVGLVEQYIADLTCQAYTYEDLKKSANS